MGNGSRGTAASVVICGAGMSGLTAAAMALECGARVALIEKSTAPGGSYVLSGGNFWTYSELSRFRAEIPGGNPVLQEIVHSSARGDRQWLSGIGVRLDDEKEVLGKGMGQLTEPEQATDAMVRHIHGAGGSLRTETALESLLLDDGRIVGVTTRDSGGRFATLRADAVILATGGYQGNPELITKYLRTRPENLYLRAAGWSTGDGLLSAIAAGAGTTSGLDDFYGHAMASPPASFTQQHFSDVSLYFGGTAIAINLEGRRFTDETDGTGEEHLNRELARQPEGRGFYLIDETIVRGESRPGRAPTSALLDRLGSFGATIVTADNLRGLAIELTSYGVPESVTLDTLESFNAACASGAGSTLVPPRKKDQIPLTTPPFYAVAAKAAITFTTGGIRIDEKARVLARSSSSSPLAQSISDLLDYREVVVPGLFAAGCDVGGIYAGGNYGGSLSAALTTGRIAGREAATRQPNQEAGNGG